MPKFFTNSLSDENRQKYEKKNNDSKHMYADEAKSIRLNSSRDTNYQNMYKSNYVNPYGYDNNKYNEPYDDIQDPIFKNAPPNGIISDTEPFKTTKPIPVLDKLLKPKSFGNLEPQQNKTPIYGITETLKDRLPKKEYSQTKSLADILDYPEQQPLKHSIEDIQQLLLKKPVKDKYSIEDFTPEERKQFIPRYNQYKQNILNTDYEPLWNQNNEEEFLNKVNNLDKSIANAKSLKNQNILKKNYNQFMANVLSSTSREDQPIYQKDQYGNEIKPEYYNTGKVASTINNILGYGGGMAISGGGISGAEQGVTKSGAKALDMLATKETNKVQGKILPAVLKGGIEGTVAGSNELLKNPNGEGIQNTLIGGATGGILGGAFKGGKLAYNKINPKYDVLPIDEVTKTINTEPILPKSNLTIKPLGEVNKNTNSLITPLGSDINESNIIESLLTPNESTNLNIKPFRDPVTDKIIKGSYTDINSKLYNNKKFTASDKQAKENLEEAVQEIYNKYKTYNLDLGEIEEVKAEMDIDLLKLIDDANATNRAKKLGNNVRLSQIADVNDIKKLPLFKPKNLENNNIVPMGKNKIVPLGEETAQSSLIPINQAVKTPNKLLSKSLQGIEPLNVNNPVDNSLIKPISSTVDNIKTNELPAELQNKLQVTYPSTEMPDLLNSLNLDKWKNKSMLGLNRETMERNLLDIAGKDAKPLIENYIDPIKVNETNAINEINFVRDKVKSFGIKAGSKDSELMQKLAEGLVDLDHVKANSKNWSKVQEGAEYLRETYDTLLDRTNEALVRNGYDPIPKRANYMPHMGEMDSIAKQLGFDSFELPTEINGITEDLRPGKGFFANALQRKGNKTEYDAIRGIDNYIEGATRLIHHTDDIQRLRNLDKHIRANAGGEHLSNFASNLTEYTNLIAGKQSGIDRGMEKLFGRKFFRFADGIRKQMSSNMIGGNLSSALTQFVPLTQSIATTDKRDVTKALFNTMKNFVYKDGFVEKSGFLTRRSGSDRLVTNAWQKTQKTLNAPFKVADEFISQVITRGKYYEGLRKGLSEKQALKYADDYSAKLMADRSLGQLPNMMKSKSLNMVAPFQVEVNNQISFLMKDLPREAMKNGKGLKAATKLANDMAQIAVASYLFNNVFEMATGRRPALDPIGIAFDTKEDIENKNIKTKQVMTNTSERIGQNIPFIGNYFGSGRTPAEAVLPNVFKIAKGDSSIKDELIKPATYLLPPTGGGQIAKTIKGARDLNQGGNYSNGKLKFAIDPDKDSVLKTLLFGSGSLPQSQEYYREGKTPYTDKQTKQFKDTKGKLGVTSAINEIDKAIGYNRDKKALYETLDKETKEKASKFLNPTEKVWDSKGGKYKNGAFKQKSKEISTDEKLKLLKEYKEKSKK